VAWGVAWTEREGARAAPVGAARAVGAELCAARLPYLHWSFVKSNCTNWIEGV
jgi:hypothetical protein